MVTRLRLRDFRSYERADVELGPGLTVITGPNGVGKTNLLEALYFGCTGRSCRTSNERELVRFGAALTRVEVLLEAEDGRHELAVGLQPGEAKRMQVDGGAVERLLDVELRPRVAVFLPERLELVKGAPGLRRAHLDQFVAALWPRRAETRQAYGRALAQRNALLGRVRSGAAGASTLTVWDRELARHGVALMADRAEAVGVLAGAFAEQAEALGLPGEVTLRYRPRSPAAGADELATELADRAAGDVERGFTAHGPHRDELVLSRDGRELRTFGSQGQQRVALLSLLLAERAAVGERRGVPPLLLLDDVMSELDGERRERLVERLVGPGQAVVTATERAHVPAPPGGDLRTLRVGPGRVVGEVRSEAA